MPRCRRVVSFFLGLSLAGALAAPLSGCLVHGSSKSKVSGRYVGTDTLSRIKCGETTKEWVGAVLGDPTSKRTVDGGQEIWTYEYRMTSSSSGGVFLLVGGSSRSESIHATYVQFKDGIVTDAWQD